jgi:alpha-galactosidase
MHRRTFIRAAGVSLGSLLITRSRARGLRTGSTPGIQFPDRVTLTGGGAAIELSGSDGVTWHGDGCTVTTRHDGNVLGVDIEAPERGIASVVLHWKRADSATGKILGDHWERGYGDLAWRPLDPNAPLPWYFLEYDGSVTSCFGVRTGCPAFCSWYVSRDELRLVIDVRSGGADVHLGARTLHAAEVIVYRGEEGERPFATAQRFCRAMCPAPRPDPGPVYGVNDWYYTYGWSSAKLILENSAVMGAFAAENAVRPFSVVDAGWTFRTAKPKDPSWGDDFLHPNEQFGDMGALARNLRECGMRPGIWVRPLCAHPSDRDNVLIPGTRLLDPTIPENLDRVRAYLQAYRDWGYDLVKFDFTAFDVMGKWGFQMGGEPVLPSRRFADGSVTTAEILLRLFGAIREAAAETIVLACNTPTHLSAGLFEICRIGDDTSGREWKRTRTMGVNALGFRICHHGTFYAADGDCVGLTQQVPWAKNKQWMQLLAGSGTPLFISAELAALGAEQKSAVKESFRLAAQRLPVGEPLDWLDNPFPASWLLNGQKTAFAWEE